MASGDLNNKMVPRSIARGPAERPTARPENSGAVRPLKDRGSASGAARGAFSEAMLRSRSGDRVRKEPQAAEGSRRALPMLDDSAEDVDLIIEPARPVAGAVVVQQANRRTDQGRQ